MEIEWLILADAAEIVANKLYLLGGGWNRFTVTTAFPAQHRMAAAVAFRVPWNNTNERHRFEIEVSDGDGQAMGKVEGQFEVGRPPGTPPGEDQRAQIVANIDVRFDEPGSFEIVARIDGQHDRHFPFYVIEGAALPQAPKRG